MKIRIYTIIAFLSLATFGYGQRRQLQEARAIIKSGKGFANAEKMMVALLKDSANLNNMRIYDMWLQSVEKQYDQVNEQMYKKQVVDTASLFGLTQRIFMIAERLDSIDMRPDKKGRVHLTYREDNAQRLDTYRPNLFFGGTYFLRKNDLQRAYDYFERYIDCAQQPLFTDFRYEETDTRLPEAAYWATYCGYRMDNPVLALRYAKPCQARHPKIGVDTSVRLSGLAEAERRCLLYRHAARRLPAVSQVGLFLPTIDGQLYFEGQLYEGTQRCRRGIGRR